ncbi:hypothetical protein Tco_1341967, partial [Tanacetum coccineum]
MYKLSMDDKTEMEGLIAKDKSARAKEIPGWVPEFTDEFDDDDESEEGSKGDTATSHG